jgi:hypothetical protein
MSVTLSPRNTSITELLSRAQLAIKSGETSMRAAAEDIAGAQEQGATQREIAGAVGKSAAWVNALLKWRAGGYQEGTVFGPGAKASRQRAKGVQAAERKPASSSEQAQASAERVRTETAKADAAKAKADAQKAKAEAAKAKADARRARSEENDFFSGAFFGTRCNKRIEKQSRQKLIKLLGMLGSTFPGERENAGVLIEKQRAAMGFVWDELIIAP